MAKFKKPLFFAESLPRSPFSKLNLIEKDDFNGTIFSKEPSSFRSVCLQLVQSLHRMTLSVVGLLIACSDIFFLLAHVARVLYDIAESLLSFVLSACNIFRLIILCCFAILVWIWDVLFFTPGLVYIAIDVCSVILHAIFQICLYILLIVGVSLFAAIASNAKLTAVTEQTSQSCIGDC